MKERLPPDTPEEGFVTIGGREYCPYDSQFCLRHRHCIVGGDSEEGPIEYCPRYPMD